MISLLHFEKPVSVIDDALEDMLDSEIAIPPPHGDGTGDGPYQTFIVFVFVVSLLSLAPLIIKLRQQCSLYGRSPAYSYWQEEQDRQRVLKE